MVNFLGWHGQASHLVEPNQPDVADITAGTSESDGRSGSNVNDGDTVFPQVPQPSMNQASIECCLRMSIVTTVYHVIGGMTTKRSSRKT
jgi:hypothetical protein